MSRREGNHFNRSWDRAGKAEETGHRAPAKGAIKWAATMALTVLVFGLVFGAGHAVAASLPGDTFDRLRLLGGEALFLPVPGEPVQQETQTRALEQVRLALGTASQAGLLTRTRLLQRVEMMLQEQMQKMAAVADGLPKPLQEHVHLLLREMERVRAEAHTGQGDPEGDLLRQRLGTPEEAPPGEPQGPYGPGQPGYAPGPQPEDKPVGPQPVEPPGMGSGPQPEDKPAPEPTQEAGPQPVADPGAPAAPEMPGGGSGPDPSDDPGQDSGPGMGSNPGHSGGGKGKP